MNLLVSISEQDAGMARTLHWGRQGRAATDG